MTFNLEDLEVGTYFVRRDEVYLKTGTTKENDILCHPISAGLYGDIVQLKLHVWFQKRERVKLRSPIEGPDR